MLASSATSARAAASAARTDGSGSGSRPESTRAKSSRSTLDSAASAAARIAGSGLATSATMRSRSAAVGRERGQRAQRLQAQRAARRRQLGGHRGHHRLRADEARRAQRVHQHALVRSRSSGGDGRDVLAVAERPQPARRPRPGQRIAGAGRLHEHRAQRRRLQPHGRPGGRPPVEARPAGGEERRLRRPHVAASRASATRPSRVSSQGSAALPGSSPRTVMGLSRGDEARAPCWATAGAARGSPIWPSASTARARTIGSGSWRAAQEAVHRRRVADEAQPEGGHLADLRLGIAEQAEERGHATAACPMRPAASAARRRMPRSPSRRSASISVPPSVRRSSELEEAGEPLDAGPGRRRRRRRGRGENGGEEEAGHVVRISHATATTRAIPDEGGLPPDLRPRARRCPPRRGGRRPRAPRPASTVSTGAPWITRPSLRGSTSTKARRRRPRGQERARPSLADGPRAPHHERGLRPGLGEERVALQREEALRAVARIGAREPRGRVAPLRAAPPAPCRSGSPRAARAARGRSPRARRSRDSRPAAGRRPPASSPRGARAATPPACRPRSRRGRRACSTTPRRPACPSLRGTPASTSSTRQPRTSTAGSSSRRCDLPREALRPRDVVGVHPRQERGPCRRRGRVQRRHQPAARGRGDAQAGILARGGVEDGAAPVAGAVVRGHDLEVAERLGEERGQALGQGGRGVADGQEDGDAGQGWSSAGRRTRGPRAPRSRATRPRPRRTDPPPPASTPRLGARRISACQAVSRRTGRRISYTQSSRRRVEWMPWLASCSISAKVDGPTPGDHEHQRVAALRRHEQELHPVADVGPGHLRRLAHHAAEPAQAHRDAGHHELEVEVEAGGQPHGAGQQHAVRAHVAGHAAGSAAMIGARDEPTTCACTGTRASTRWTAESSLAAQASSTIGSRGRRSTAFAPESRTSSSVSAELEARQEDEDGHRARRGRGADAAHRLRRR